MALKKIKNKILDSSDMYNHYKNENEILANDLAKEIKSLKEDMNKLKKENQTYKKDVDYLKNENKRFQRREREYERIFKSNTFLFNKLFVDFNIPTGGLVRAIQDLGIELLNFTDIICKKYGFEYWIDYGNVLGAYRHKGFIPWDDDLDVSMMRKDYNEFLEVVNDVIKDYDPLRLTYARLNKPTEIMAFSQLSYNTPTVEKLAGIDYFTMDFASSPVEDIENVFKKQRDKFHIDLINSTGKDIIEKSKENKISFEVGEIDVKKVIEESFDSLNITYEKGDYIIPGIEGVIGGYVYPFALFEYEDFFPLGTIEFENRSYPCVNNVEKFLTSIYGEDYMFIPRRVRFHGRQERLRYVSNIEDILKESTLDLREFNSTL